MWHHGGVNLFSLPHGPLCVFPQGGLTFCQHSYSTVDNYVYLSHIHPNDTEKIQSELLGASINRIENNRIKTLAQRSAWIGNDETHYARKHEDLGLSEMKRFIKAMLTYVESELAFEEAESISRK